jgi:gluconate 5-dehydrogenase
MAPVIEQRGGEKYLKSLADAVPMRKTAAPEDVVGTAIFLASPASDYMTGNILYPDGGLTAIG